MRDIADSAPVEDARILQIGVARFAEAPGGLPRSFEDTVSLLAGNGFRVKALVCGRTDTEQQSDGRYVAFAPTKGTTAERVLGAHRTITRTVSEFAPAVVGSHFALYSAACGQVLRKQPHIVHFHGPWASEAAREGAGNISARLKYLVERYAYGSGDLHIVLSSAFADILEKTYRISPHIIRVVPGTVDTARFNISESRREARKAVGWPTDRPIILAVRRMVHRVGLHNLIAAVSHLRMGRSDALVIIAGEGPLRSKLQAQIEANELDQHVRLVGHISDDQLPAAYRAADLTVVPSEALEGFGLPTIESLACGTPVIVTPVGGLPEVIEKLQPELITADTTGAAIAGTILSAINGQLALPTSKQCSDYVLQHFAPDVIGAKLSAAYRELL